MHTNVGQRFSFLQFLNPVHLKGVLEIWPYTYTQRFYKHKQNSFYVKSNLGFLIYHFIYTA